jgi:hypothetical protein
MGWLLWMGCALARKSQKKFKKTQKTTDKY